MGNKVISPFFFPQIKNPNSPSCVLSLIISFPNQSYLIPPPPPQQNPNWSQSQHPAPRIPPPPYPQGQHFYRVPPPPLAPLPTSSYFSPAPFGSLAPPPPPSSPPPGPPPLPPETSVKDTPDIPPPPPRDEKTVRKIEVLCQYIAKNGDEFEHMTCQKEIGNPEFEFLFGGAPGSQAAISHEYFKWMKKKCISSDPEMVSSYLDCESELMSFDDCWNWRVIGEREKKL